MGKIHDKTGREIMVGDVLKVYHFTAALRRKKHFMYKQVVGTRTFRDGTPCLEVSHLDLSNEHYVLVCDGAILGDHEIIQSIDCKHEDRPRLAPQGDDAQS
ncbi:hypothetical protein IB276_26000 [Ensifer sp. ENS04]|uniref:hypothetical protein n=1 Tax=Ensifer sp. ENS04 TaxID=2769281 RepID=UPI001785BFA9|nr:hypothetical protein [Ensifer sp. ENS04]MBD9542903.1 hypothetical protein [Ensifer sp. ENS04]